MSSVRAKRSSPSGTSMSESLLGRKWWKEMRRLLQIDRTREELLIEAYNQKTYETTLELLRRQYGGRLQQREQRMRALWLRMVKERPQLIPDRRRPIRRTIGALISEVQREINKTGMKRWRQAVRQALVQIPWAWKRHERIRAARLYAYLRTEAEEQRQVLALLTRMSREENLLSMSQISEYVMDWQEKLMRMFEFFPAPQKLVRMLYSYHWVRRSLSRLESRRMRFLSRKIRRCGLGN
uniref:NS4 n=1 Tax=Fomede virus TaxID=2547356 RepID=A0A482A5V8_9REOV|nr:NS4 [Fomede virus]